MASLLDNGKLNTIPWIGSTLQQYQMDAWQQRIGEFHNRRSRCYNINPEGHVKLYNKIITN
jgi:hypothetical protein